MSGGSEGDSLSGEGLGRGDEMALEAEEALLLDFAQLVVRCVGEGAGVWIVGPWAGAVAIYRRGARSVRRGELKGRRERSSRPTAPI